MRVVIVSKAMIGGTYQRKAEEIARLGVDLTVLIPPGWTDRRGRQFAERLHVRGYELRQIPQVLNGNYHLHFYPTLALELQRLQPDIVHVDEEPYNLATWLGIRAGRRLGAATTFFSWQNIMRRYPPPFVWMEQANYRACSVVLAGNQDAADVMRSKGYTGVTRVIPQFGVSPELFSPRDREEWADKSNAADLFHVGYAGGLIREKGVDLLLQACANLRGNWRLSIVGTGEAAGDLRALTQRLGIAHRVDMGRHIPNREMPDFYRSLDVLVLPSRTQPNWKEQFGRVLIEAMACGVPVVGSDSGEIPNVVGSGGLIFPQDDVTALAQHLQHLLDEPSARRHLARLGVARVMSRYTMGQVAEQTVSAYRALVQNAPAAEK